jgi:hypothetical protein
VVLGVDCLQLGLALQYQVKAQAIVNHESVAVCFQAANTTQAAGVTQGTPCWSTGIQYASDPRCSTQLICLVPTSHLSCSRCMPSYSPNCCCNSCKRARPLQASQQPHKLQTSQPIDAPSAASPAQKSNKLQTQQTDYCNQSCLSVSQLVHAQQSQCCRHSHHSLHSLLLLYTHFIISHRSYMPNTPAQLPLISVV